MEMCVKLEINFLFLSLIAEQTDDKVEILVSSIFDVKNKTMF